MASEQNDVILFILDAFISSMITCHFGCVFNLHAYNMYEKKLNGKSNKMNRLLMAEP